MPLDAGKSAPLAAQENRMRWAATGLAIGALLLLIPAIVYVRSRRNAQERSTAKTYLVPGLIVLGIAAVIAAVWLIKSAP
jgi:hypothetical protein